MNNKKKTVAFVSVCFALAALGLVHGNAVGQTAASAPAKAEAPAKPQLKWEQTDESLALMNGPVVVWKSAYKKGEFKHYFHPLALLDGTTLTAHRPPDHPWHLGMWFCWKYLNKLNYWEEDKKTGLAQGLNEITDVKVTPRDDFSAVLELSIAYSPRGEKPILTEKRTVTVSAPDANGRYHLDWSATFTAVKDVEMERTPPKKSKEGVILSGGYAGLALRVARDGFTNEVIADGGKKGRDGVSGQNCRWAAFDMTPAKGTRGTLAVLGHPDSFRFPEPYYVVNNPVNVPKVIPYVFLMPEIIANEPYTLPAGKTLTLRYRVLIQPGAADPADLEEQAKAFEKTK